MQTSVILQILFAITIFVAMSVGTSVQVWFLANERISEWIALQHFSEQSPDIDFL